MSLALALAADVVHAPVSPWIWAGFLVGVIAVLAIDLGLFHKESHEVPLKEAAAWTAVWVSLAAAFNVVVWLWRGPTTGLEFTTGYLIELALSVDNLFVFLVLFASMGVPRLYQHRVLFWGILGALVMRFVFIMAGAALIQRFDWIMYVFGGFLVITGLKLMQQAEIEPHPERNVLVRMFRQLFPITGDYRGPHFVVREGGRLMATPLLVVLVTVEATDVVFAVDSIPAIFGITRDSFIVFTSNIFAILGLRSMFFLLAGVMDKFHYLKYGLAVVLVFVGSKMILAAGHWYHVPIGWSLAAVVTVLGGSVALSLLRPKPPAQSAP